MSIFSPRPALPLRAVLSFLACAMLWLASVVPAQAQVVITFWSQEFGQNFPHAFFTLEGTPEAGGAPVKASYGFTAKTISPAILMGSVGGRIDETKQSYIDRSNAHFSTVLTDAQYAAVLRLVDEWGVNGDSHYNLNRRNCVHFVAEAARRSGLTVAEEKRLMKKPRSFTQSMAAMNAGKVRVFELPAKEYYALVAQDASKGVAVAAGAIEPAGTIPAEPATPVLVPAGQ